ALRENMYLTATVSGAALTDVLHVPREAVIRSGKSDRVIVALGQGRFASRTVTLGPEAGERVVISAGVAEGDRVVTSGLFLIDAEANLRAALQRLEPPTTAAQ